MLLTTLSMDLVPQAQCLSQPLSQATDQWPVLMDRQQTSGDQPGRWLIRTLTGPASAAHMRQTNLDACALFPPLSSGAESGS